MPSYVRRHAAATASKDYIFCVLIALIVALGYFLFREQVFEFLPRISGVPLMAATLDWEHQLLVVVVVSAVAAVFGAGYSGTSRWVPLLGLILVSSSAIAASQYLQVVQRVSIDIIPAVILPASILIFALLRESLRNDRAMFIKEMALLHKDTLLKTVFENTFDSIFVVNDELKIIYVNDAALGLLGYKIEDIIGLPVDDLCPNFEPNDAEHKISYYLSMAKWEKSQIGPHPTAARRASGTIMAIELTVGSVLLQRSDSPFEKRKRDRFLYVCNFWDSSLRDKLETMRGEGYDDQIMTDRSMAEFVANMSHELRTPLNAIMGFSELLESPAFGELSEKQQEYVGDIHSSANHLLNIINDILDISKVESGKNQLHEEEVSVAELIKSCIKMIENKAEQSKIEVCVLPIPESYRLHVDKRKLKQVLINLLSNAVKFTRPGGSMEVQAVLETDGSFTLAVTDTGIGIRSRDIAIALAPFGQVAGGLNRKYEGTGLGLPLANSLVEAHGGKLTIKSRHHIGTTVTVSLPPERVCKPRSDARAQVADNSAELGEKSDTSAVPSSNLARSQF